MAKKFLTPLNIANLPSDPISGSEGDIYFNTTRNKARIYINNIWEDLNDDGASVIFSDEQPDVTNLEPGAIWVDTDAITIGSGVLANVYTKVNADEKFAPLNSPNFTKDITLYGDSESLLNITSGNLISNIEIDSDHIDLNTTNFNGGSEPTGSLSLTQGRAVLGTTYGTVSSGSTGVIIAADTVAPTMSNYFKVLNSSGNTIFNIDQNGIVDINGGLSVSGAFYITGSATYLDATNLNVTDSIINLSTEQQQQDLLDQGFTASYGQSGDTEQTHKHRGLVYDKSVDKWKLFSNIAASAITTTIDFTNSNSDTLIVGSLEGNVIGDLTGTSSSANFVPYTGVVGLGSNYLTLSSASSTYLTQSNASSTYLTQSNASSTYLTQVSASTIVTAALTEKTNTISSNYTITSNNNAMSIGTTTINNGITVTIPVNSSWCIV